MNIKGTIEIGNELINKINNPKHSYPKSKSPLTSEFCNLLVFAELFSQYDQNLELQPYAVGNHRNTEISEFSVSSIDVSYYETAHFLRFRVQFTPDGEYIVLSSSQHGVVSKLIYIYPLESEQAQDQLYDFFASIWKNYIDRTHNKGLHYSLYEVPQKEAESILEFIKAKQLDLAGQLFLSTMKNNIPNTSND